MTTIFITGSMITPNRYQHFSSVDRLQHTIQTANSIRKYYPDQCFLILAEGSKLTNQQRFILKQHYNVVLEYGEDTLVQEYVNRDNIGKGEMKLLELCLQYIKDNDLINTLNANYLVKLGARYSLSDKFDKNKIIVDKYNFRLENCMNKPVYCTGLYTIPIEKIDEFIEILQKGPNLIVGELPIERIFYELIKSEDVHLLEPLGLEGRMSYNGTYFSK